MTLFAFARLSASLVSALVLRLTAPLREDRVDVPDTPRLFMGMLVRR